MNLSKLNVIILTVFVWLISMITFAKSVPNTDANIVPDEVFIGVVGVPIITIDNMVKQLKLSYESDRIPYPIDIDDVSLLNNETVLCIQEAIYNHQRILLVGNKKGRYFNARSMNCQPSISKTSVYAGVLEGVVTIVDTEILITVDKKRRLVLTTLLSLDEEGVHQFETAAKKGTDHRVFVELDENRKILESTFRCVELLPIIRK